MKERISDLEDRTTEMPSQNNRKTIDKKNKQSLRNLWEYSKRPNILVIRIPKGKEKGGLKKYSKK